MPMSGWPNGLCAVMHCFDSRSSVLGNAFLASQADEHRIPAPNTVLDMSESVPTSIKKAV
jgi:hypothetical protein